MSRWHPGAEPIGVLPRASLVGRDGDAEALEAACSRSRLVTLLGAGGAGKTALAAAVAPSAAETLGVDCWWVDLQPVEHPAAVAPAVAAGVEVPVAGDGRAAATELARTLGDRALLLVLDNCEQVIDGVAEALEIVAAICPNVRVLATSREVVGIAGEEVRRLRPLPAPAAGVVPDADVLMGHAATSLFLDRAGLDPSELDGKERGAVAGICRAVDGLPLAIELAAARSPALTPAQIEAALADRFRLLSTRRRTVADRQQTLEASIGWSYGLLDDGEQRLLRSVAVFPSAFDLAAAAAVGAGGDEALALDVLAGLIDKSLVAVQERPSGRRYRLYESVRAFGERELARHAETGDVADRHVDATLDRLARLGASQATEGLILRTERWLTDEMDDIRAASTCALAAGRPDVAVDLWWAVHVWGEAVDVTTHAPEVLDPVDPGELDEVRALRRDVLLLRGTPGRFFTGRDPDGPKLDGAGYLPLTRLLAATWGVYERTTRPESDGDVLRERTQALLELLDESQPDLVRALVLIYASRALHFTDGPAVVDVSRRAAALADRVGVDAWRASSYYRLAIVTAERLLPEAAEHVATLLSILPRLQPHRQVLSSQAVTIVAWATGDLTPAIEVFERYTRAAGAVGSQIWAVGRILQAELALWDGRPAEALQSLDEALTSDAKFSIDVAWCQAFRALALIRLGDLPHAAAATADARAALAGSVHPRWVDGIVEQPRIELALAEGRPGDALDVVLAAAGHVLSVSVPFLVPEFVLHGARALAALDRPADAARSVGVLQRWLARPGAGLVPTLQGDLEEVEAGLRDTLGDTGFDDAASTGHGLSWGDWLQWLERGRGERESHRPATGWAALTDAEVEVATHAAAGLTNAELAETLFVSVNTVKTHIRNIYTKLDVHSRAELANFVAALN